MMRAPMALSCVHIDEDGEEVLVVVASSFKRREERWNRRRAAISCVRATWSLFDCSVQGNETWRGERREERRDESEVVSCSASRELDWNDEDAALG